MASLNDIETKVQSIINILYSRTVKTITGILPLAFTAKAGNAVDWEIRGNDENGTENLMQIIATSKTQSGIIFTVDGDGRITINGTATSVVSIYLDWLSGGYAVNAVEPNTTYTVTGGLNTTGVTLYWGTFNSDGTATQTPIVTTATITTSAEAEKSRGFIYITEGTVCDNLVCEPMLVKGSTAPDHYIPYQKGVGEQRVDGYYIPLTVSQQGQTDKTVDIYIGDAPLTEGETVSKTSTGVDLELFEGENTVSTTLYNKPEMTIKYKYNGGN